VTVTIQRRDWSRSVSYWQCHDCLLVRAVRRTLHLRLDGSVYIARPTEVVIWHNRKRRVYRYNRDLENRLEVAHRDPSLLPMTIRLR